MVDETRAACRAPASLHHPSPIVHPTKDRGWALRDKCGQVGAPSRLQNIHKNPVEPRRRASERKRRSTQSVRSRPAAVAHTRNPPCSPTLPLAFPCFNPERTESPRSGTYNCNKISSLRLQVPQKYSAVIRPRQPWISLASNNKRRTQIVLFSTNLLTAVVQTGCHH